MKKIVTIIAIVLAIAVGDLALTYNNFIVNSDYFVKNDFEITQYKHPEKVWDKVFFGNSVVISAYMEDESSKGYVNLGLDYGVVTDLWEMIEKKHINIGSELVIGLNYLTLYDEFETNPTYIWHKKLYEPYAYFERDRFYPMITDGFDKLLNGESPLPYKYLPQEKHIYHGAMSDKMLEKTMENYQDEFFNLPTEKFSKNVVALEKIINYCNDNNIRVRAVWMPWNTKLEQPELLGEVKRKPPGPYSYHAAVPHPVSAGINAEHSYVLSLSHQKSGHISDAFSRIPLHCLPCFLYKRHLPRRIQRLHPYPHIHSYQIGQKDIAVLPPLSPPEKFCRHPVHRQTKKKPRVFAWMGLSSTIILPENTLLQRY